MSKLGQIVQDRVSVIYSDAGLTFESSFDLLARYVDEVRQSVARALSEEAVLIVVMRVFHAA